MSWAAAKPLQTNKQPTAMALRISNALTRRRRLVYDQQPSRSKTPCPLDLVALSIRECSTPLGDSVVGMLIFHGLVWSALLVIPGVLLAFSRRIRDHDAAALQDFHRQKAAIASTCRSASPKRHRARSSGRPSRRRARLTTGPP